MQNKSSNFIFKKIEGYLFSPFELVAALCLLVATVNLLLINFNVSGERSIEKKAEHAYDLIRQAAYNEMSSSKPMRRYLIKDFTGPGTLPEPLSDVFLDEGVKLNYLIRVYQPAKRGRPRDQLRFEVTHEGGTKLYRYLEVRGQILEQVIHKAGEK